MTLAERRPRAANVDFQALLCVAASTRAADAARIVATFECANPTAICVTKLDETVVPSGLVHVSWAAKKAIALVCSGPRVPEDISAATFDNLFARLEGSVV